MALYRRHPQDTCRNGHPYTEANTIWVKSSRTFDKKTRNCRQCYLAKLARRKNPDIRARNAEKTARWRKAHPDAYREGWQRAHAEKKQILLDARKDGCIRCGEKYPACLDFHHRNGKADKLGHIGLIRRFGLDRLRAELAKCDVLCANCHRKLHWEERQRKLEREG